MWKKPCVPIISSRQGYMITLGEDLFIATKRYDAFFVRRLVSSVPLLAAGIFFLSRIPHLPLSREPGSDSLPPDHRSAFSRPHADGYQLLFPGFHRSSGF